MVIFVIYLLAKQICHLGDFEPYGGSKGATLISLYFKYKKKIKKRKIVLIT
jgi:hypothetical protein